MDAVAARCASERFTWSLDSAAVASSMSTRAECACVLAERVPPGVEEADDEAEGERRTSVDPRERVVAIVSPACNRSTHTALSTLMSNEHKVGKNEMKNS